MLDRFALVHGAPHYVRFDNGPEFVAHAVRDWCRFNSAGLLFIDPGPRAPSVARAAAEEWEPSSVCAKHFCAVAQR